MLRATHTNNKESRKLHAQLARVLHERAARRRPNASMSLKRRCDSTIPQRAFPSKHLPAVILLSKSAFIFVPADRRIARARVGHSHNARSLAAAATANAAEACALSLLQGGKLEREKIHRYRAFKSARARCGHRQNSEGRASVVNFPKLRGPHKWSIQLYYNKQEPTLAGYQLYLSACC